MLPSECNRTVIVAHLDDILSQINSASNEDAQYMRLVVNKVLAESCFMPEVWPAYKRFLDECMGLGTGTAMPMAKVSLKNYKQGIELIKLSAKQT